MIATMKDVVKSYGDVKALNNLNLEVKEGEILGLLGPNGAGKTTAIRVLCGLIKSDSGETTVFGEKQSVTNLATRRDLGIVTQEITVFTDLSAIDNLRYFGGLYGLRGAELESNVKETLEFVGLSEHAKKRPKKFSGGMKRRLNIACALVHKPKLLIMDEPTVGIDPQSRNHILESVKKIAENGTTVIYTTHYMEEVQAVCSRISIMDAGMVIADGTLEYLIGRVQHEDKVRFTANTPSGDLTKELEGIDGVKTVTANGSDYTVISKTDSGNVNKIMEVTTTRGGVSNFSMDKPNLEDVFLTLTGKRLRDEEA